MRVAADYLTLGTTETPAVHAEYWLNYFGSTLTLVGVFFSAAWFASQVVVSSLGFQETALTMVARAIGLALILVVGASIGRAQGVATGLSAFVSGLPAFGIPQMFGAALWGTVFWLRAPKAQTAGIAA
jgi:hypothetical protein